MKNKILSALFLLFMGATAMAQVTVTSSDSISCTNLSTTLTSHLTGDAPTDALITRDDYYSVAHAIGFTFNFYGNNYTQIVIGPNGTLDFDVTLAGAYANWMITAPLAGNPTVFNSICGPWCDIDISPAAPASGIITYSTTGTAPYRKFIVTFCKTHMYSCTSQITSAQIILYETTNIIETHIGAKPVCSTWNSGAAIIGVENFDGSASTVAPGRDFPATFVCANEAWRFTPDATVSSYAVASIPYAPVPLATSTIYWYNVTTGAYIGTGASIVVSPTTPTTYAAGALGCADTSFGYYRVVPSGTISTTLTSTPVSACNGSDGAIMLSGITPGLTVTVNYMLNGVAQPPLTLTASVSGVVTIPGLIAGVYTNIIVTSGSCSSLPLSVTLAPPPIAITATTTPPTVCGYSDATIRLAGYTASTAYTISYTLNGTPVASATYTSSSTGIITLTGLSAGTYTNIVSTGGPCPPNTIAGPIVIANPAPPVVTVDSALVNTCVGIPVQLHAYSAPASVTEYYTWTPATNLSSAVISNPVVTPTATGNIVYVVSGNPSPTVPACAYTVAVTVHAVGDFVVNNPYDTICLLTPRVSVPVSVTGSPEIAYAWTPTTGVVTATSMSPTITPNAAGVFVYVVHGSYANCPDFVHTVTIKVDTPARGIVLTDTVCLGMTSSVDFTVPGGGYYHYQWTSTPPGGVVFSNDTIPNPSFTSTAIGQYYLIAYVSPQAAGCGVYDSVILLVLPNAITTNRDTAICAGQVVQGTGTLAYNGLFTYQWIPTAGIANSTIINPIITPDTSAVYTITASFPGCPDIHASFLLDVQPNPTVYVGGNRPMCQFDSVHINASVSPAWYSHYIYSWAPAADLDNSTSSTVVFTGSTSTNVVLTVTTPAGCIAKDSALISVQPGNFAIADASADYCPHDSKTVNILPASGYTYQWFPSMYTSDSFSGAPVLSPITTQTYSIIVTSAAGCRDTVYYTATVYPAALIELGDSLVLYPGESYHITPSTNCSSFTWFPMAGLSNPFISDPTATPDVSTQYVVTGITEHGCVTTDTLSIYVAEESLLAMPNGFTPGTGSNNSFKIILKGIASLNYFRVYNRWGNVVFETTNMSQGWDGTYKGEPQDMGVYVYDVQAVSSTGKVFNKKGNVTLLR